MGVGLEYWGGGIGCESREFHCSMNGNVKLSFGSAEYLGPSYVCHHKWRRLRVRAAYRTGFLCDGPLLRV